MSVENLPKPRKGLDGLVWLDGETQTYWRCDGQAWIQISEEDGKKGSTIEAWKEASEET